jgi:hypothetical protein
MYLRLLLPMLVGALVCVACSTGEQKDEDFQQGELAAETAFNANPFLQVPPIALAEEFDCVIEPGPAGVGKVEPIDGTCEWQFEKQGEQWLITFHEEWVCDDFAADSLDHRPCDGEKGSHEWEYLVDLDSGSVLPLADRGQFAPQMLE